MFIKYPCLAGWLQSFVVKETDVLTSAGLISLSLDDGRVSLAGGRVWVDEEQVLHRTGKSGGTYTYAPRLKNEASYIEMGKILYYDKTNHI